MSAPANDFDAVLFLSFGGPDKSDDVMPFLRNVSRGRGIPEERLAAVAEHYYHFGGVSPINRCNLDMIEALRQRLDAVGPQLPVYFGNRNWRPYVADTLADMYADGHRRVLVFPTSPWGGYSGCRQYHEDIAGALERLCPPEPVQVRKVAQYWNRPEFIAAWSAAIIEARAQLPLKVADSTRLVFTAHSVPLPAEASSGPAEEGGHLYTRQIAAAARSVASAAGYSSFDQVWQSRSGPPNMPWLEPDILDHLDSLAAQGVSAVIVCPIGFISDHLEVIWDLDNQAAQRAEDLGMSYVRTATVGTDPRFVAMVADLIGDFAAGTGDINALGCGDNGKPCRPGCCAAPTRRHPIP